MAFTSYIVENDRDFQKAIDRLGTVTDDFRIPFGQIASAFYKENQAIFKLKAGGEYDDLAESTKRSKKRKVGFIYPILVETGRLASSLVNPGDPETVRVIQKLGMELGTSVHYAVRHQDGTKFMPMRKVVFIGGGPTDKTKGDNRRDRWLGIIDRYIKKKTKQAEF